MRPFSTLRARLALWVAALLFVGLAIFGLAIYTSSKSGLYSAVDDALRLGAAQAAGLSEMENGALGLAAAEPAGREWQEAGITIRLFAPDGRLAQAVGPARDLPQPLVADFEGSARAGRVETLFLEGGARLRLYTDPIEHDGQLVGVVQVAQSLAGVQATLGRLLLMLVASGPLLALFAGIGGYYLAGRMLAPIDHMIHTADRITTQHLSARLNLPPTQDEVGRLATALDGMLARFQASFRREQQFAEDVSHELRTPLAAMRMILMTVLERRRTPEEYEEALADLADETRRLHSLAEDILLLARGAAPEPARFEPVDLSTMIRDVTDSFVPLAEARGLALACAAAPGLRLMGDADALIRLLVNLLDNAIKYTCEGGVRIRAARCRAAGLVQVTISDTGAGIAAEHLPHIFDRFYRAEPARTERGAGLGLAIAAEIARGHGGRIEVRSEVGRGTTFVVLLAGRIRSRRRGARVGA